MPPSHLPGRSLDALNVELQVILDAIDDGLVGVDANDNVTFCNEVFRRMTGSAAGELIGKNLHIAIHHKRPDGTSYPEHECNLCNAAAAAQEKHVGGATLWRKDGTCLLMECNTHPVQQFSGDTVSVVTVRDITEHERTVQALKTSEKRFRRILSSVADIAWTADRDGHTLYVSPKIESVLGYTKREICAAGGAFRMGLIHPNDFGRVKGSYLALFDKQIPFSEEYRIRRKDDSWIWIHDRATGTRTENGIAYADGVFSDISARKRAESDLRSNAAFLEAQTNSTMDGMVLIDPSGRATYANRKYIEMFPRTPEIIAERQEHAMLQYASSLVKERGALQELAARLNQHPTESCGSELELSSGTIIDFYAAPVIDEENRYYGRIWTVRDVTERKRNEDLLRQLSMAVEQSPASVVITDPAGNITHVNRKFTEITGYQPAEVLGKNPRILKSGFIPAETYRELWSTITQGREWRGELCNRKKNGEIFWETATIRPITNASGRITHLLALKEDITERRRVEHELRLTQFSMEHASDAVEWIDSTGRLLYVNQAECRDLGRTREEILSLTIPEIDPLFSKAIWSGFWSDLKAQRSMTFETQHKSKQGRIFPVEVTANYVEFNGKEYCFAFARDISERRRAQEELQSSRQMLQSILDAIPQRVFWKDRNCAYLGCNQPFATDAGLRTPAEIVGKSDFDLSWAAVAELYRADDKLVMEQGAPKLNFHERQLRSDGSDLWLQTNKLPLFDTGGKVSGVVGTYEDITERKRAERELRLTKSSLDVASDGVLWIDPEACIVYANEAASKSLGRSQQELHLLSVAEIAPDFTAQGWADHWKHLKSDGFRVFETRHQSKTGRTFPVEISANYLEFDGREYSFCFARDITERRELESQLRQAQKLEGIGQLAAGIAHEINTPTQFVTDNLTFLRDSWKSTHELVETYRAVLRNPAAAMSPGLVAQLENAERSCDLEFVITEVPRAIDQSLDGARRVAEIVRAMKEFSHPDSADKVATDLNKAISSTITVARNEWKYVADVATRLEENLPPVVCYPGDVNQVVLNLLVNAAHAIKAKVKEGEKGKITICTRKSGDSVEISVGDTGTGIPEAIRARVFDPFFTTKEVGKGTGQGLSLAHTVVVKKHGGKIWFETDVGQGTTFFISLPINPGERPKEE